MDSELRSKASGGRVSAWRRWGSPVPGQLLLAALALQLVLCGCGSEDGLLPGPGGPGPLGHSLGLLADSSRDGHIGPEDDDDEERWTRSWGALLLPNLDDDDGDGLRDADDARVNLGGERDDLLDLTRLQIAPWPGVPANAVGRITIDALAMPHVRIFAKDAAGSWQLLGGSHGPCGAGGDSSCELWLDVITLGAEQIANGLELRIEARRLAGVAAASSIDPDTQTLLPWSGLLTLRYALYGHADASEPLTTEGGAAAVDELQLRVAPWLAFDPVAMAVDTVFAGLFWRPFDADLHAAASASGAQHLKVSDWPSDPWTVDWMRPGFVSVPGQDGGAHGMIVTLPRSWGRSGTDEALPLRWLEAHLGPDSGFAVPYVQAHQQNTYESFGNHLLVPGDGREGQPHPLGRVLYGTGASVPAHLVDFYDAQEAQVPALSVDSSWLWVGHVDEVFSFVPAASERGWKVLVASPALAVELLETWRDEGHGGALLFADREGLAGSSAAISIDELLSDVDLMASSQEAQARIDDMVALLGAELELGAEEWVPLPVLFEHEAWGKVAFTPAAVNALVWGDTILVPEPFGPLIDGADALRQDLLQRLASPDSALGSDGQGLDVRFADAWWYHLRGGQVHCGSNQRGHAAVRWWQVGP